MSRLLSLSVLLLLITLTNCNEQLPEVKDNIFSALDNSQAETHFSATFDAAFDVITSDKKFGKTETSIIPSTVDIIFLDSSFDDGDGLEVVVDFGKLGTSEPKGTLCQDGRYRAGKLTIKVNQSIQSSNFRGNVIITDKDSFFTGNGTDMAQLTGTTTISLAGPSSIRVVVSNAKLIDGEKIITWSSDRIINQKKDKGPGLWGDEYEVTGTAQGINREGEEFLVTIDTPLLKRLESGCASTFVQGVVTVSAKEGNQVISINYDPYDNSACDKYAEANLNGRKTIFRIR